MPAMKSTRLFLIFALVLVLTGPGWADVRETRENGFGLSGPDEGCSLVGSQALVRVGEESEARGEGRRVFLREAAGRRIRQARPGDLGPARETGSAGQPGHGNPAWEAEVSRQRAPGWALIPAGTPI